LAGNIVFKNDRNRTCPNLRVFVQYRAAVAKSAALRGDLFLRSVGPRSSARTSRAEAMILEDKYQLVVVGSGFCGATIAYKVATELGLSVLVIERRSHIGGNAHSRLDDETGIECHEYGSHLFHTSNESVWRFINQFSSFNNYRHRVFTKHRGKTYTMPINLMTINQYFGRDFNPHSARVFIERQVAAAGIAAPRNLEDRSRAV
jgi:hypothetical protein